MEFAKYPSLKNRTVLVTGGASGIGADIVRAFAAQGSKVGLVDIDATRGTTLAEELSSAGEKVAFEHCDLREIEALKAAYERLKSRLGPAEVLVNNAAHDERHDWKDVTPEYYDERIAVNLRHMFFAVLSVTTFRTFVREFSPF